MKTRCRAAAFFLAGVVILPCFPALRGRAETLAEKQRPNGEYGVSFVYESRDGYGAKLLEYTQNGYPDAPQDAFVTVEGGSYTEADNGIEPRTDGGFPNAIYWPADAGHAQWEFSVPADGLYMMTLSFCAADDKVPDLVRSLTLDGEIPFSECSNLRFHRVWRDDAPKTANLSVRPEVTQERVWRIQALYDADRRYDAPFLFYLTAGNHVLEMDAVYGSMLLGNMTFSRYAPPKSYAEIQGTYDRERVTAGQGGLLLEAEGNGMVSKNSNYLRSDASDAPEVRPYKAGDSLINVIGGTQWQDGGSSITWKISVEKPGLYQIAFHLRQNYREGLPSYRAVEIDGEIPFSELREYPFAYQKGWRTETLSGADGQPYLFYLTGEHTLTLRTVQGPLREVLGIVEEDSLRLSETVQQIRMITGQNPDVNYDYGLARAVPGLLDGFGELKERMRTLMALLLKISGGKVAMYYQLDSMVKRLDALTADPFRIPRRMGDLDEMMTTYGEWQNVFRKHPLLLDSLEISAQGTAPEIRKSGFLPKLWAFTVNFGLSFVKDYGAVSGYARDEGIAARNLSVWVGRGVDWAQLIKTMADEEFTPQSKIGVSVNILPGGQLSSGGVNALLLAVASGKAPDVCVGAPSASVGEFALRNALKDLTDFEDFNEIKEWVLPELIVPAAYRGGVYGLPETMNFTVMAYRKDILSRLGLSLPNTWEELYTKVIPILNQSHMQVYVPNSLEPFLYQLGGQYYAAGMESSGLGSPEAYLAFKELCELYTIYGVPVSASFYNRFRTGEMPLGIIDYSLYMTIRGAAPELDGRWGIAPIPGHLGADGSLNQANAGAAAECVMIFSDCGDLGGAWAFLKWWLSAKTQSQYGYEIESLRGATARWNSANLEAFSEMAWAKDDLSVILESLSEYRGMPVVLGGYFTARHVGNAFNRTVISGMNPRDSLEQALKDIDRELRRRRESNVGKGG
jgi:ABC-type glycerol-3-phosphate transport system substrate-binding protein